MADRATTPREWAIAVAGGLALAAGLVWVLRGPEAAPEAVVLSEAPVAAPVVVAPAPPVAAIPVAATVDVGGYKLRGLIVRPGAAASAILESADGRQRLVRAGSPVAGGRVESIDSAGVVIASGGSSQRIGLGDGGAAAAPVAAASGAVSAPLRSLTATPNDYRLGLRARRDGGRTTGYVVTDLARLPAFRMAGMKPGDVLLSVNGSAVSSEEKLLEMPAEIAGAYAVDIVYESGGKQRRGVVTIER